MVKVIGWIDYDDYNFLTAEANEEEIEAVIKSIKENGFKFGGNDHENLSYCCPLLSNGKALRVSWRSWGYIMAKAYDLKNDKGEYNYILWYMGEYGPENRKLPTFNKIDLSECEKGKEINYEVNEYEYHSFNNASFTCLVLPIKYYEKLSIHTLDKINFIFKNEIVLSVVINGDRFMHCTVKEFLDKNGNFTAIFENSNYRDFNEENLLQFLKNNYSITDDDNLIILSFDILEDNRKIEDIFI